MVKTDRNKFLIDLCESDRTDFGLVEFGRQSEVQRVFSAVWELEAQVNNGGFDQFFYNRSGDRAQESIAALEEIGAQKTTTLLKLACNRFPKKAPSAE